MGNTQLMSDLTDNQFYPSTERICLCIRLNNAEKWISDQLTYIHNWSLQPFSQDQVSHTIYVLCVLIFIHKRQNLQFKVDSERQIFEKLFMAVFIYSQSFCQKSAERKSPKKYSNPGFSSNKPTHYLLGHGDITLKIIVMLQNVCENCVRILEEEKHRQLRMSVILR